MKLCKCGNKDDLMAQFTAYGTCGDCVRRQQAMAIGRQLSKEMPKGKARKALPLYLTILMR
jgi:hypothetical protein